MSGLSGMVQFGYHIKLRLMKTDSKKDKFKIFIKIDMHMIDEVRGNILPHVQYHCLVRPSFPTCAVPPIIFELSVPIFQHVQYHPNISEL